VNDPEITVIIPTWNRKGLLRNCLKSLSLQTVPSRILVVDNGSSDGTVEMVAEEFPEVDLLPLAENLGFAKAVNRGIEASSTPFLALLNNDTEADPGWLAAGLEAMRGHPEFGFFASRMIVFDHREILDSAGDCYSVGGLPTKRGFGEPISLFTDPEEVLGASAGAAFYRKSIFETAGLFDESYYLYLEDVELSLRSRCFGFRCLYLPDAVVYHIEAASDADRGSNPASAPGRAFYSASRVYWITRNRWQLMITYQPIAHLPHLALAWIKSLAFHFLKAGFRIAFLQGLLAGIRLTGMAWAKRRRLRSAGANSQEQLWHLMRRC